MNQNTQDSLLYDYHNCDLDRSLPSIVPPFHQESQDSVAK